MENHRQSLQNNHSFDLSNLLSDLVRIKQLLGNRKQLKGKIQNYSVQNNVGIRLTTY